jgi:MFS family permease
VRIAIAAVGAVLVAVFSVRALAHPEPLLRIRLLRNPTFGRGAAVLALFAAPYFGTALLLPTYVQILRADSASVTAALFVPAAVGMGLSLQVAARLLERLGPRLVVATGLGLAVASGLATAIILRPDTSYVLLGALALLQGAGVGAVMMPTMSGSSRDLDGPDLASGAALLSLISTISNGIGTVAFSTLFSTLTVALTGGDALGASAADTATAVDAQRLTRLAAVAVMSIALGVRLRSPRRIRATMEPVEETAAISGRES